jgi:Cu2+-exporting ATPase
LGRCGVAVDPVHETLQQDLEADGASLLAVASDGQLLGLLAVEDQHLPTIDACSSAREA